MPRQPLFHPITVVDFDLSDEPADIVAGPAYRRARVLVRIHTIPIGVVTAPVIRGVVGATDVRRRAMDELGDRVVQHLIADALAYGIHDADRVLTDLAQLPHPPAPWARPTVSVAVCTRDRPEVLRDCIASLERLTPHPDEILVIDNAPTSDATARLAAEHPSIRYLREDAPGLDRARARAVVEARSDVIAFTDDDVIVDPHWVGALRRAFADPEVSAVTGLVMAAELETEAQELFERYGGFGRGFERRWYRVDPASGVRAAALHGGTGKFGTGANMAFRRRVFDEIGTFDPALDVGTVTNGGGDLEMFFRVLDRGHLLVYEPAAMVWHRHRRTYEALRQQIENNGIGFYSYLVRSAIYSPRDRTSFARLGAWWLWYWNVRRLVKSFYKPGEFPRDLIIAELTGSIRGLFRYQRARRTLRADDRRIARPSARAVESRAGVPDTDAARDIDITDPVRPIENVSTLSSTTANVRRGGELIGRVTIDNAGQRVSEARLRDAIASRFGALVLGAGGDRPSRAVVAKADAVVAREFGADAALPPLDPAVDVSIVIATRNRPADLRRAIASLMRVHAERRVEIIVVDNDPASGVTGPIVAEFRGVRLVEEARPGLSYARNAGIAASTGSVIVATDDDVVVPEQWLERLLAPFADPDVMAVTGNVIPWDLSSPSQRLFEQYGGLGRGSDTFTVDAEWFWSFRRAVPTWLLGGTANAAFRATVFADPRIGMLNESLGAGTPAGCSEDTDLFYRILSCGYRLVYRGDAFVWHRHRGDMPALRRQLYAYSKGHVAYQLTTLVRDGDVRALARLFVELPRIYVVRVFRRVTGRTNYPLRLIAVEIAGTMAGPLAWWRSKRRARRLGTSARYVPVDARGHVKPTIARVVD